MSTVEVIQDNPVLSLDEQEAQDAATESEETENAEVSETVEDGAEAVAQTTEKPAEDLIVQIGDAEPEAEEAAPAWVKELRKRNRELDRQNRELMRQVQGQTQQSQVGAEPKLEDFDYDADKFKAAYAVWFEAKRKETDHKAQIEAASLREQTQFAAKLQDYSTKKTTLGVKDFADAEALVEETLNPQQQAVIVKYAKNPALVVYALGKNLGKMTELARSTDLLEFGIQIRELENQLKVTPGKKTIPAPEKRIEGTAPSGNLDGTLERLRAEAQRTGDFTKVLAYKNRKKAA